MQILKLKLCNLASLAGEHCIDFQQEPLKSAGLIAITGRTGSGKSTLLDALCLGLYNQIPRFKASTGQGTTQEFGGASDTRQILTRGTAYAYAEVEFIGVDQKRYISRTDIGRAYKKVDGTLKNNTRAFISVDENQKVLSTKIKECDALVVEKTGLEYEQFTRAVLLAQSEVGAFLKAPDDKRAQLLEHLTASGIFKKIGELAYEQHTKVKNEYEQAKKMLGTVELLAPEILTEKTEQYQNLLQQLAEIERKIQEYQRQEKIHLDEQQLQRELKQYQQALLDLQAEDLVPIRERVAAYELYQQIAPEWKQLQDLSQKCLRTQQEIVKLEQEMTAKQAQQQQAKHDEQQLLAQYELQIPQLKQKLTESAEVLDYAKARQKLRDDFKQQQKIFNERKQNVQQAELQIQQKTQDLQNIEHNLTQLNQQLLDLAYLPQNSVVLLEHLQNYQKDVQAIELKIEQILGEKISIEQWCQSYQQIQKSYTQFSEKVGAFESIQQQRQGDVEQLLQLQQQQQQYQTLIYQLEQYLKQQQQVTDIQHQLQVLHQDIQQVQAEEKNLKQAYDDLHQQWQNADDILQKQRLIQSKDVVFLRTQLEENQPCMVCGSVHHPWQGEAQNQDLLALQEQQVQFFMEKKEQAHQKWMKHQQQISKDEYKIQHNQTELDKAEAQQKQCADVILALELATHFKQHELGQAWQDIAKNQLNTILGQIEDCNQSISKSDVLIEQFNQFNQQLEQHSEIEQAYRIVAVNDKKVCEYLTPILLTQWHDEKAKNLQKWLTDIQQKQQYEHDREQQLQLQVKYQADLGVLQKELQHQQEKLQEINLVMVEIEKQGKKLKSDIDAICQKYQQHDLTEIEHFEQWQQSITLEIEQWQQQKEQSAKMCEQIKHDLDKQNNHLQVLAKYLQEDSLQQQQLLTSVQHWQQQNPTFNDSVLNDFAQQADLNTSMQKLKYKISSYEQKKIELESNATLTQQKISQLNLSELMAYDDVCQLISELSQSQENYRTESQNLAAILKAQEYEQARLAKHQEQLEKVEKEYHRWQRIHHLIGINKGVEFQKAAQQHYLDILLEYANFQLHQLTQRYELKRIDNSLSLSIIDYDMNDEQRGVLSLSGGESFLVSLALALGIAHMASSHLQLEMLFIDEGFGTLDQTSLHMVMDTLDRLQGQGRKVILISHIQEIHERIPVQIKIEPKIAGHSQIHIQ